MNCDTVFEILTRGPFPSGDSSDETVERHLALCHTCRQLAEALRPAVDLLHESVEAEEGRDLPGYHGVLCAPAVEHLPTVVQRAVDGTVLHGPKRILWRRKWGASSAAIWRYTAAAMLGLALCVALWSIMATDRQAPLLADGSKAPAPSGAVLAGFQGELQGREMLVSLHLPRRCFDAVVKTLDGPDAAAQSNGLLCCTECHNAAQADGPRLDDLAVVTMNQSCHVCHSRQ